MKQAFNGAKAIAEFNSNLPCQHTLHTSETANTIMLNRQYNGTSPYWGTKERQLPQSPKKEKETQLRVEAEIPRRHDPEWRRFCGVGQLGGPTRHRNVTLRRNTFRL